MAELKATDPYSIKAGGGRCYKSDKAFQCW